jgi:cell division protein FtsB
MSRGRLIVGAVIAFAVLWVAFFDSHSLLRRAVWHYELSQVAESNLRLEAEIDRLERQVTTVTSDAVVERVAREQYGMRRPGETVYRIETE